MKKKLVALTLAGWSAATALFAGPVDFSWTTIQHGQLHLSDLAGKIVVLELIYSTCKPCLASLDALAALNKEYAGRGIVAYAVAFDPNAPYVLSKQKPGSSEVGWASGTAVHSLLGWAPGEVGPIPQLVLLDRQGQIRYQTDRKWQSVPSNDAALRAKLDALLQSSYSK